MNIGLVYGYDLTDGGEINEQTRCRCMRALELYKNRVIDLIYITVATQKDGIFMGREMKHFFLANGVPNNSVIFVPGGFNTAGETDTLLDILHGMKERSFEVTAITSWYHAPRVWFLFAVRKQRVNCAVTWGGTRRGDITIEPLKILNALLRPYRSSKRVK